jgi:PAS domain-containing protein
LPIETWLGSGTAVLDSAGQVTAANDAFAAWLGVSAASLHGKVLAKLLGERHPDWEQALQQFLARDDGFDRLELAGNNGSGPERLTVELCAHGPARFLHFESVMPPVWSWRSYFLKVAGDE